MRISDLKHACKPLQNVSVTLPPECAEATIRWRCPTCGLRWRINTPAQGRRDAISIGRESRKWRRQAALETTWTVT